MTDEKKPPEGSQPPPPPAPEAKSDVFEAPEATKEEERALEQGMRRMRAARDAERLAGVCFDMGSAMRKKAKAIEDGNLKEDILAAHEFNEGGRQFKSMLAVTDRSHRNFLQHEQYGEED